MPVVMEDVPLPRPVACTVPAESADSGGDGGPSSLDQDSGESKFEPAAMKIEVGETEVNMSQVKPDQIIRVCLGLPSNSGHHFNVLPPACSVIVGS